MIEYRGKYASARVHTDMVDETTSRQICTLLNCPAFRGSQIEIMPDCHAGAGAVIGFTATLESYVIPNVVGVDIGCGVLACRLDKMEINLPALDNFIRKNIPAGFTHRSSSVDVTVPGLEDACFNTGQNVEKVLKQLGTLGSGNHFLEIDRQASGELWLVIHTGSRNFGLQIAKFYQKLAQQTVKGYKDLEYLDLCSDGLYYLEDMRIAQCFAKANRQAIADILLKDFFEQESSEMIESVHNYIGEDNIVRKGAISAYAGQKLLIPLNMRDGTIVGIGKGNPDWNYSAPHGAGRVMSRSRAKRILSLDDFQHQMQGIYTTTANRSTLDEAPGAYKDADEILSCIDETVDLQFVMKPIYSFKSADED